MAIAPGETVVFDYTVTNGGNVPLSNVQVYDSTLNKFLTLEQGDTNNDGKLDLDEVWRYAESGTAGTGRYETTATVTAEYTENGLDLDADDSDMTSYSNVAVGCSVRFWKKNTDQWDPYNPNELFRNVVGIKAYGRKSLQKVLTQGGTTRRGLGKQTVAALLNAEKGNYPLEKNEIIDAFVDAFSSRNEQNYASLRDTLKAFNNNGECPLDPNPPPPRPTPRPGPRSTPRPGPPPHPRRPPRPSSRPRGNGNLSWRRRLQETLPDDRVLEPGRPGRINGKGGKGATRDALTDGTGTAARGGQRKLRRPSRRFRDKRGYVEWNA